MSQPGITYSTTLCCTVVSPWAGVPLTPYQNFRLAGLVVFGFACFGVLHPVFWCLGREKQFWVLAQGTSGKFWLGLKCLLRGDPSCLSGVCPYISSCLTGCWGAPSIANWWSVGWVTSLPARDNSCFRFLQLQFMALEFLPRQPV